MPEILTFPLPSIESAIALAGDQESNLKLIGRQTGTTLVLRGQEIMISGTASQITRVQKIFSALEFGWKVGQSISEVDIKTAIHALDTHQEEAFQAIQADGLARNRRGDVIRAKTFKQRQYVEAVRKHSLTFGIGPAGTGKTYLAAVLAIQALLNNEYERLILTRPAVEAGEKLGFLPGDLQQKVNPYLRPLYDALYEFVDPEKITNLMERQVIEIAPIAYMRGRTLSNAFVIVDEAQNTTPAQMKMLLTRLGFKSKMVVTGDLTQTDLPPNQASGLQIAEKILRSVEGIEFCYFSKADVIRHPLVQRIVEAYEIYEHQ
ncbi:PhoH family protein [Alkalinema sp. FACHB-956]|uniref:PhoH family protein n=1 Tax=Alkalinema sp. FACHB-956 TaxID=2692768 RepID=UPI0016882038|nr:PhoH family protein [Alkalinema sp. FACHB-956]MBD2328828.1 PhoH family protein [Alkalinema sp. FACHB-956]